MAQPWTARRRGSAIAAAAALATGALLAAGAPASAATAPAPAAKPPVVTHGPCKYTSTPDDPAARPVPLPPDPRHTPSRGTAKVTLKTNRGDLPLTLDRAEAPCTVQSFVHLAEHKFYDRTICHRLTLYSTLKVLQCGDPTGTGEGGPGYSFKDELPTNLKPWPTDPTGVRKVYPRGTLAMANAGPNTNGSQFFLVFADSALPPLYSIFGTVNATGLVTLDTIAAGGVQPSSDDPNGVDGPPALTTKISKAKVSCR